MTNGSEEIPRLREEIRNLGDRVHVLENRLRVLERGSVSLPSQRSHEGDIEARVGLTWVNRIGAVTLAIGVLFLFNYAVEKQWITIWGRIILGLLVGVALVGFSNWLLKRDQKIFSQGVYGCGVAVFYISLYFGFDEYRTHHQAIFFLLCLLAVIFGLLFFLALRWDRILVLGFNAIWAVVAAGTVLRPQHPGLFAWFVLALAIVHFALYREKSPQSPFKIALYVIAHSSLLIAVSQWLIIGIRYQVLPASQSSTISESLSFLFAGYAVVMITAGFLKERTIDRLIGLAAIGLVILKLYVYDVWQLDRFYRISAFVALGILLLAASYLYSRWKDKLDAIWADKPN